MLFSQGSFPPSYTFTHLERASNTSVPTSSGLIVRYVLAPLSAGHIKRWHPIVNKLFYGYFSKVLQVKELSPSFFLKKTTCRSSAILHVILVFQVVEVMITVVSNASHLPSYVKHLCMCATTHLSWDISQRIGPVLPISEAEIKPISLSSLFTFSVIAAGE